MQLHSVQFGGLLAADILPLTELETVMDKSAGNFRWTDRQNKAQSVAKAQMIRNILGKALV